MKIPSILGYDQDRWASILELPRRAGRARAGYGGRHARLDGEPAEAASGNGVVDRRAAHRARDLSTEDWLRIYGEHLEKHSRQIERNLEAWRAEETKPGV